MVDPGLNLSETCSSLQNNHLYYNPGFEKAGETTSKIIGLNLVACSLILTMSLLEAWHPFHEGLCKENIWINDTV